MTVWVQKFGGTSVATVEHIKRIAHRVLKHVQAGRKLVIVLSAMGKETNRLLDLAHACQKSPDPREYAALLASGEQVSVALLSLCLAELGVKARSNLAWQLGLQTDARHKQARLLTVNSDVLQAQLEAGIVPIVAGFQGMAGQDLTTLGRGGSDTTAVFLAARLKAERCQIFTDVPGIFNADPNVFPEAVCLPEIDANTMLQFSQAGAQVLHPESVQLAMAENVPLQVCSTLEEGEGTWVQKTQAAAMKHPLIACETGLQLFAVDASAAVAVQALLDSQGLSPWAWKETASGALLVLKEEEAAAFERLQAAHAQAVEHKGARTAFNWVLSKSKIQADAQKWFQTHVLPQIPHLEAVFEVSCGVRCLFSKPLSREEGARLYQALTQYFV